ncbi:MAG: DMT family transporter [Peptostreptococcaceae bacterium]
MKKYLPEIGLMITAIIWGTGFIGTQLALDGGFTPLQILSIRFFIPAILLNIIFLKSIKRSINKKSIKAGIVLGIFLFIAFQFQTIGLVYTTPSKNAFITAANVIIVPFIGFLIFRRKIDRWGLISSLVAIIGIGILSLEKDLSMNLGDLLTLFGAVGFAFHIFFTGEFAKNNNPIVLTSVQFIVAFILSFVVQIVSKEVNINAQEGAYLGVIYLGIFSTTICFLLQTICQKMVTETKAAIILSTESLFGTILSIIIFHEAITFKLVSGCILIFAAIIVSETKLEFLFNKNKKEIYEEEENVNLS